MNKGLTGNIIEIIDAGAASFEGVLGVSEYSENIIVLKLKNFSVKISGDNIHISEFEGGEATIEGKLLSLSFHY